MLLVADVHGAFSALATVAQLGEPLLVLGDLLNFIDYRTNEGMLADVAGKEFVAQLSQLRSSGDVEASRRLWAEHHAGREDEIRARYRELIDASYSAVADALTGAESYVTFGNADRPDLLQASLPPGSRFVDGEVVEVEGYAVGFIGGGVEGIGVPGEVPESTMADKLAALGDIDILCTHVAPAIRSLSMDVIGGRLKQSQVVREYIEDVQPPWHYFGDIHQPQATMWRVGRTVCRNVGYFRATGIPVRHR
ncbi:MAG: metallophosphoesterase [Acidobacteria bacterium]|nr:metallophosphoesterase [Acidobacteriota bacterium]